MHRFALGLCLGALAACGTLFPERTSQADRDLNNFAEARERAAFYYDGGDYTRAALQYQRALQYREDHVPSKLGLAYSLTFVNKPSNLLQARQVFEKMGRLNDAREEVKRIYGLALNSRALAVHYERRARIREKKGRVDLAAKDQEVARRYAQEGLEHFQRVIEIDDDLATRRVIGPYRVSASLKPDAHAGMAHCEIILADYDPQHPQNLEEHLGRAEFHIRKFAQIAKTAREFWEKRRERLLVEDALTDDGAPAPQTLDADAKQRYEVRILATITQEVEIRRALMLTLLYLNRYQEAIDEATLILELDPGSHEVYLWRGNAYAFLKPPNYRAAVADLKRYRQSKDLTKLTDELVQINRRILLYEKRAEEQEKNS
jgi:tetratricopeptide (TPR) repeat protein